MAGLGDPASYEAWYRTPRGRWIGDCEFNLLQSLMQPRAGTTLLDVGCGTGYFTRRFAGSGLAVTGIDPDRKALAYARKLSSDITYLPADATRLPFADQRFDYSIAVTSLCFIADPRQALGEMWRVTEHAVLLGLLNRHSLLYRQKQGRGSYRGARWDTAAEVTENWIPMLRPEPRVTQLRSAVFLPKGGRTARWCEKLLPGSILLGAFLAVYLEKLR